MKLDKPNPLKEHKALTALAAIGVIAIVVSVYLLLKQLGASDETPGGPKPILTQATVKRVVSGHYVKLSDDERLIYAGIRAPFENEPYFQEAKKRNEALVVDNNVDLQYDTQPRDSDGRLLAYAFLGDGTHINLTLVREGLAYVRLTPKATRYAQILLAAQSEARLNKRGMWATMAESTEASLVADPKYAEFHRPSCEVAKKISEQRRETFKNKLGAFEKGFAPCNKCLP